MSLLIRKLPLELKYVSQWIYWAPCWGVILPCLLWDNPTPRWHMEMPTALQIKESLVFHETGWLLEGRQWARLTQVWSLARAVQRGSSWHPPGCPYSFLCIPVLAQGPLWILLETSSRSLICTLLFSQPWSWKVTPSLVQNGAGHAIHRDNMLGIILESFLNECGWIWDLESPFYFFIFTFLFYVNRKRGKVGNMHRELSLRHGWK